MNVKRLQNPLTGLGLPCCLAIFLGLGGCGSKSDQPTVVTPPSGEPKQSATEPPPVESGPPGGLEMPPEGAAKPPAKSPAQTGSSKGLELPEDTSVDQTSSVEPASREGATESAKVQYATWEEIEKFATSSGRVTVVDLWSTVCEPCIKEFPGLVKLHNEHGESIQCISVSVDYDGRKTRPPEKYEEAVVAVLSSFGSTFPNYISRTPSDDVYKTVQVVSIPAVLIFDADGKLVKKFVDANETAGFSYEKDIIPLVTKLAG